MLKRWQDLIFWLPILLLITYGAYRVIPAIDPRSGIDGWGDLFAGLIAAVKGVMVTVLAWMSKRLYWWEPSDNEDQDWHYALRESRMTGVWPWQHPSFSLILFDRLELIVCVAFWYIVLF